MKILSMLVETAWSAKRPVLFHIPHKRVKPWKVLIFPQFHHHLTQPLLAMIQERWYFLCHTWGPCGWFSGDHSNHFDLEMQIHIMCICSPPTLGELSWYVPWAVSGVGRPLHTCTHGAWCHSVHCRHRCLMGRIQFHHFSLCFRISSLCKVITLNTA